MKIEINPDLTLIGIKLIYEHEIKGVCAGFPPEIPLTKLFQLLIISEVISWSVYLTLSR